MTVLKLAYQVLGLPLGKLLFGEDTLDMAQDVGKTRQPVVALVNTMDVIQLSDGRSLLI